MKPDGHEQMKLPSVFWQLYLHGFGVNSHSLISAIPDYGSIMMDYIKHYWNYQCSDNEKLTDTLNAGFVSLVALITDTSVGA
jgi:NADPH-dependent 7-cyano-7-deazaguanine reductase QueF